MRLWPSAAFFFDLLVNTFGDINFKAFLGSSMLLILTASTTFWVLNMGRENVYDDYGNASHRIYPKAVDNDFLNAFFFAYITSQGEYRTEEFEGENAPLLWIIFFGVTFLIQVTFLNMLIAIMGHSFQTVLDNKQQSAMKEKIKIISDFRLVLRWCEKNRDDLKF